MPHTTRRELLASGGTAALVMAVSDATPAAAASVPPIVRLDAVQLSKQIRERQISCREVMVDYLDHIDGVNPQVNAIVSLQDPASLIAQAQQRDRQYARGVYLGFMHGFPHAVKDLANTAGIRTTLGSPIFRDNVPATDAIFVERLKRRGAIIIGKTNTPEFGLGSQTYNTVFGTTLNAYDQSRTAGGSSGGAAVAVALRMVPFADGSDFMGSLRNPAAWNNVIGFRPSVGRVPFGPTGEVFAQSMGYDGPIGRTVRDVAKLLSIMAGYDARAPMSLEGDFSVSARSLRRGFHGARIAFLGDLGGYLPFEPGVLELCRSAFPAFADIGAEVVDALPAFDPGRVWDSFTKLRHWLIGGLLFSFYDDPARRPLMKPEAQFEVEEMLKLTALDVYNASVARSAWYQALRAMFEDFDFLMLPSAQVFPFAADLPWPREIDGRPMDTYHRWMEVVAGAPSPVARSSTCRSASRRAAGRWACRSSDRTTPTSPCCSSPTRTSRSPSSSGASRRRSSRAPDPAGRPAQPRTRSAPVYTLTRSPRAKPASVIPRSAARCTASELGAPTPTRIGAPATAAFWTSSNDSRPLTHRTRPWSGTQPSSSARPTTLSIALWRPTSSRTHSSSPPG